MLGSRSGQQVGWIEPQGQQPRATVWFGSPESAVELHPAQYWWWSFARHTDGERQVGSVHIHTGFFPEGQAVIWNSSAGSIVYLTSGYGDSAATGIDDGRQVGYDSIYYHRNFEATLWNGTPQSRISLHPAGYQGSQAWGIEDGVQVGLAWLGEFEHAGLWRGTSASWVDLHPSDAERSEAYRTDGITQVGKARFAGLDHAGYWRGSAASWVDLHPNRATTSSARDVLGSMQVGGARFEGRDTAALWAGDAASFVDLHTFLPKEIYASYAHSISFEDGRLVIAGSTGYAGYACMWRSILVQPSSHQVVRGRLLSGSFESLLTADDARMVLSPGPVLISQMAPIEIKVVATAPVPNPASLGFITEAQASSAAIVQAVRMLNFETGLYEQVELRTMRTTDSTRIISILENPARFVQPGTNKVEALISYRAIGPVLVFPWQARIDQLNWMFPD
jgi:hypothetical protein